MDAKCDPDFCMILKNVDLCCMGLLTPTNVGCVETSGSGLCDRITFDDYRNGEPGPDSQFVCQAWLWNFKQILLYQVGSNESPAGSDIVVSDEFGMQVEVKKVVEDLQAAVDVNFKIPQPA